MIGLGSVEVVVEFHPPVSISDCGSRKSLAHYCHARVAGGMAAALAGRPQPVPEPPTASAATLAAISARRPRALSNRPERVSPQRG
jgi:1-acyl-sn-glycerol-3-phosphate acyltransferase